MDFEDRYWLRKSKSKIYNAIRKVYPQFGYSESDIYLSSYPKSGRSWVQFLVANAIELAANEKKVINFKNISDWVSIDYPKKPPVESVDVKRMVARHELYRGQNTRVIYLIRNPADVMVSYYNYNIGRKNMNIDSVSHMIRDEEMGIKAWVRHVKSWENEVDLLIKFEDLKTDSKNVLKKIIRFLGLEEQISNDIIKKASEKSSFENMRKIENKWGLPERKGKSKKHRFMRKGATKEGLYELTNEDLKFIKKVSKKVINKYGYDI
jgi:hypothetical protein